MPNSPIKIATTQSVISSSISDNGAEIRKLMRQAKAKGARLIHFCEGALSGYVKTQIKNWENYDWDTLLKEQQLVAAEAKKLSLWTVIGSCHRLTPPHRPYNSLLIVSDRGDLATRYDKRWCSNSEINDWFSCGESACVFEVDGWRFGCALCIEIQFPEVFMEYMSNDVDCVLFSTYSDKSMFGIQAQGYAASHNYWISSSIPVQENCEIASQLIGPSGVIQASCLVGASSVIVNELDYECDQWEIALKANRPWRAIAREGSIYKPKPSDDVRSIVKTEF